MTPLRTLYISYFGALKHLSHSQVLPYLKELARGGIEPTLLSFEEALADGDEERRRRVALRKELADAGVDWRPLRYHKRPSLPATGYDVAVGTAVAARLIRRKQIDVIHARNHVPGLMALGLRALYGPKLKILFDLRGVMAEEYVEAGRWRQDGVPYRLVKQVEQALFAEADSVVMLTHRIRAAMAERYPVLAARRVPIEVIPCCVDLEKFRLTDGAPLRRELGLEDKRVVVYSGNMGGWYMTEELVRFFDEGRRQIDRLHFLVLSQSDPRTLRDLFTRHSIAPDEYTVTTVPPAQMPRYLAAADFGVHFIKPGFSMLANSPTKIGEYLACGLPILTNAGIGDTDELIATRRVGMRVERFEAEDYRAALRGMLALLEPAEVESTRKRCRQAAEEQFSLKAVGGPRYLRAYAALGLARSA